ncbi:uncharacterized protein LOC128169889 isoform X2 [Crassostrea angulata]|uniref:uncharacterized protein LOC128169889 isoform X2 n=1 Tax=Magallana angulata TaxID=2784310 RepID=UPI0022B1CCA7|nr:uncharacterized protein LOC128169889 isoform X2 [Crassostrea angulata]
MHFSCTLKGIITIGTSSSSSAFGSVLKESVKIVDNCPDSKEKWREAADKMKCAEFAGNRRNPEKFVYHCIINSFVNQTQEVCAKNVLIFEGSCAEYSASANKIQGSHHAKYPGCFTLTNKNQTKRTGENASAELKPIFHVILCLMTIALVVNRFMN